MAKPIETYIEKRLSEFDIDLTLLANLIEEFKHYDRNGVTLYGDGYGETEIVFRGYRPENEQEKKKRLEAARKEKLRKMEIKAKKEREEREQLRKLLLKYEGITPEELHEWPT